MLVSKTSVPQGTVGSNPTLSANTVAHAADHNEARTSGEEADASRMHVRRGDGVADRARLESVCARKGTVGSNPTLSAITSLRSTQV